MKLILSLLLTYSINSYAKNIHFTCENESSTASFLYLKEAKLKIKALSLIASKNRNITKECKYYTESLNNVFSTKKVNLLKGKLEVKCDFNIVSDKWQVYMALKDKDITLFNVFGEDKYQQKTNCFLYAADLYLSFIFYKYNSLFLK